MLTSDKNNLVNKLWHHLSWGSIGQLVLITLLRPQQLIHNSDILQPVIRTKISHIISAWLVQITTQHELMLVIYTTYLEIVDTIDSLWFGSFLKQGYPPKSHENRWNFMEFPSQNPSSYGGTIDRPLQGEDPRSRVLGPSNPWGPGPGHTSCYTALDVAWHLGIGAELRGRNAVSWEKKGFDQEIHGDLNLNRKSWGISNDLIWLWVCLYFLVYTQRVVIVIGRMIINQCMLGFLYSTCDER